MMVVGTLLAGFLGAHYFKKEGGFYWDYIAMMLVAFVCALLGAVLTYIFVTYPLGEIWTWIKTGNYNTDRGVGLVFYGGLLGGIPGFFLGKKLIQARFDPAARCAVTMIPLGHAFGRIGCFLGGCCYGIPYTGFGAVTYPEAARIEGARFPVQLLEAALLFCLFGLLLYCMKGGMSGWRLTALYGGMYSVIRFITEFFRGDEIRGRAWLFSTSQWISLGIFAASMVILILLKKLEGHRNLPVEEGPSLDEEEEAESEEQ